MTQPEVESLLLGLMDRVTTLESALGAIRKCQGGVIPDLYRKFDALHEVTNKIRGRLREMGQADTRVGPGPAA